MKTHAERRPVPGPWRSGAVRRSLLLAAVAAMALHGCGGSGGVDSGGTGWTESATLAVGPISGYGSIVVGGVHYDETAAHIVDGDDQPLTGAALTLGSMTRIDASEVTTAGSKQQAQAQTIRVSELLLGPVESADATAQTVRVLGQLVAVTPGTVFEASIGSGVDALHFGMVVAVHGQIDSAANRLVATRIEPRTAAGRYVVSGVVGSVDRSALRLRMGTLEVGLTEVGALPAALAPGVPARIKLRVTPQAGVWSATELRLESLALPDRANVEIEGRVSAFTSAQRFSINGTAVVADAASFSGGTVRLGARVEVEGRSSSGTIIARRVSVDEDEGGGSEALEIEGRISAVDSGARTFVVRGVTVSYADGPRFEGGDASDLRVDRKVSVKGRLAADRSHVEATSIHIES